MELLQVADPGLGTRVQRGRLMRVLAVAQLLAALEGERDPLGPSRRVLRQVRVDHGVVGGGVGEDFGGEVPTQPRACARGRSEEHTSELQSRENLVCRLLLEKKKKKVTINVTTLMLTIFARLWLDIDRND